MGRIFKTGCQGRENETREYILLNAPNIEIQKDNKVITNMSPSKAKLINLDGDNLLIIKIQDDKEDLHNLIRTDEYNIKLATSKISYPSNLKTGKKEVTFDLHNMKLVSTGAYQMNGIINVFGFYDGNREDISNIVWDIVENDIDAMLLQKRLRGFEFVSEKQAVQDFNGVSFELKLPKRGTSKSAGYDIFAPYDIVLQPNEDITVPTGLKAYMQDGEVLLAFPRSGLGFKFYCRMANTIPVIDGDYYNNPKNEGHIFVKLRNEGTKEMTIKQGDGMCQMLFMPFLLVDEDSFDEGDIRNGGFGSTTK